MDCPKYISLRVDTGSYTFRWVVPVVVRPLLGGRREITKSLNTDNKRLALRLARRLAVLLERATFDLMAKRNKQQDPSAALTAKLVERLIDGTVRIEGLEMDPDPAKAEEDRKHLAALLGKGAAPANAPSDGRTLADLVKAYLDQGDREKRYTLKTRQELDGFYSLVLEVMGEKTALSTLSRKDFAAFKDVLCRLPKNRSKSPIYRGKGALELAAMKIPQAHLMSTVTINKILTWTASLLGWGKRHGFVADNFADGLKLAKGKRQDEYREPYTTEEVLRLKDAVLRGLHGAGELPWRKWVPLMLAYQGMRVNEAAQLSVADVGEVDGIPVVTITDEGEGLRRVKTSAARRTIPLHPEILRLGFLDHVAALRKRGVTRLWPELSAGRDGYGQAVSKWWSYYREKISLAHRDLHSLRHTVATALREADVSEPDVQDLLGHARGSSQSFQRYAKAATAKRLHAALSKLRYGDEPGATPLRLVAGGLKASPNQEGGKQ